MGCTLFFFVQYARLFFVQYLYYSLQNILTDNNGANGVDSVFLNSSLQCWINIFSYVPPWHNCHTVDFLKTLWTSSPPIDSYCPSHQYLHLPGETKAGLLMWTILTLFYLSPFCMCMCACSPSLSLWIWNSQDQYFSISNGIDGHRWASCKTMGIGYGHLVNYKIFGLIPPWRTNTVKVVLTSLWCTEILPVKNLFNIRARRNLFWILFSVLLWSKRAWGEIQQY